MFVKSFKKQLISKLRIYIILLFLFFILCYFSWCDDAIGISFFIVICGIIPTLFFIYIICYEILVNIKPPNKKKFEKHDDEAYSPTS